LIVDPGGNWEKRPRSKKQIARDIAKIFLLALVFVALAMLFKSETMRAYFDIENWRNTFQEGDFAGGRVTAALVFVGAGGLAISIGVPRIWVAALGGAVYGAVLGSVLAILSALIGAALVYQVGRYFLQDVVDRRVGGRLEVWKVRFRENGFWWVLYGRLFPFSNSTAKSLLCGSCNVPFAPYLLASFLGFIPHTVVFAVFGSGGAKASLPQIVLGFCLMLLVFLSRNFLQAIFPVRKPEAEQE
jgi:uncharacterized membrane protein YdjX (TVP38/TMEM64 family)